MILLFNLFLLLGFSSNIIAFDVRVLLEKLTVPVQGAVEYKISSQHGMIISGIDNPIYGAISILCSEKEFVVNGIKLQDQIISIFPELPLDYDKKIYKFVYDWYKDNQNFCQNELHQLADFYDKFVNDRNFRDYEPLYKVMQNCIDSCIQSFIGHIERPVVSYGSLVQRAQQQLASRLKVLLTDAIHEKKASKKLLQQIKISEKVRLDFFIKIFEQILIRFLNDYLFALPHKIINQAMKEETGCLIFDKNKYLGIFYLMRHGNAILLINSLDIDDYLFSVLRSEGWPGWPMEVNKALVIASRTYLVEKILQANKSKRPYHIVNTIKHQTYKGYHKFVGLKQAVDETHNVFIAYKGEPIVAMFDACCGGVIPAQIEGMDYKKHPYLARVKSCIYCKKYWIYDWKKEFSSLEIIEVLRKDHPDLQEITDIKITQRDSAGLVKQVLISTKNKKMYVTGKKMYSLFPAIKSFCYNIKKKGKLYIFQGRGYGHHIGLCQWGSFGMVQDNWNYKNILQFYYPGTDFMKLSLSR